jgi:hypothetical protein
MEFNKVGFMGLYGGMTPYDIKEAMELPQSGVIYDHMGVQELTANKKRIVSATTMLDERYSSSGIRTAESCHESAGRRVRADIEWAGETLPEDLPMAKKSVQQIRGELKKTENELKKL